MNVAVPSDSLEIRGTPNAYEILGASGLSVSRRFCPRCGSTLFTDAKAFPGMTFIKGGSLDDPSRLQPTVHIWCDSAQPWDKIPEGATCVPKNPDG